MDLSGDTVEQSISVQAASTPALVEPGLALAMGEVRRQYAVALSENNEQGALRVRVRNVVSLADYQAVKRLMAGIRRWNTSDRLPWRVIS